MKRREFITLLGGAAAGWPLGRGARRQTDRVRRIGVLSSPAPGTIRITMYASLHSSSGCSNWVGPTAHNVRIDYRFVAGNSENFPKVCSGTDLRLAPDVILAPWIPGVVRRDRSAPASSTVWPGRAAMPPAS